MPQVSQRVNTRLPSLERYIFVRSVLWWLSIAISLLWNCISRQYTLDILRNENLSAAAKQEIKQTHIQKLVWVHAGVWLVGLVTLCALAWRMNEDQAERQRAEGDPLRTLWDAVEQSNAASPMLTDINNGNIEHVNQRIRRSDGLRRGGSSRPQSPHVAIRRASAGLLQGPLGDRCVRPCLARHLLQPAQERRDLLGIGVDLADPRRRRADHALCGDQGRYYRAEAN